MSSPADPVPLSDGEGFVDEGSADEEERITARLLVTRTPPPS
jgi:hypothetical protein